MKRFLALALLAAACSRAPERPYSFDAPAGWTLSPSDDRVPQTVYEAPGEGGAMLWVYFYKPEDGFGTADDYVASHAEGAKVEETTVAGRKAKAFKVARAALGGMSAKRTTVTEEYAVVEGEGGYFVLGLTLKQGAKESDRKSAAEAWARLLQTFKPG